MRNRVLKALAALGLSVCVLAGSAVAGMAEGTPGEKGGLHRACLEDHDRV